jgi:D-beta-D-heptose 7-phosphate kinase/D-beta-D-heptose 1-phosphate adenosyltransferase
MTEERSSAPFDAASETPVSAKVRSLAALVAVRAAWRAEGKTVVFTNGCFDLLHPGHVRYLRAARALGDALIVAINSDRSVRALKGPQRPILRENERAEVLAALEMIDCVTVFDDVTPLAVIEAVRPDVLVKGGDWALDQIIGRETVEAAGGAVCSLPFVPGVSTTEIVTRIRNAENSRTS